MKLVGAHIMQKRCSYNVNSKINVDVSDGLVNGAIGTIVNVINNDKNVVNTILVHFDNETVGLKCIQTSSYRHIYDNAVPICKLEVQFLARGKKVLTQVT